MYYFFARLPLAKKMVFQPKWVYFARAVSLDDFDDPRAR